MPTDDIRAGGTHLRRLPPRPASARKPGRRFASAPAVLLLTIAFLLLMFPAGRSNASGNLAIFSWEASVPPTLLIRFEEETGIHVAIDVYVSNEALLANLKAGTGRYDIVVPSDYMVNIMIEEGLLLPIDVHAMPNFTNVKDGDVDPWFDPGRKFTAPYMSGTTGFFYDSAQVDGGVLEESWKEFFDPRPELVGKIAALDDQRALYSAAAFYLGIDPCTEDPADAKKILDVLLAQGPKLAFYSSHVDIEAEVRQIADGKVAVRNFWNGAAHRVRQRVKSITYVYPKEGIEVWNDSFAVPIDAPHPDNAKAFINWMMHPRNIAEASNFTRFSNSIRGAEQYMDVELIKDRMVSPPAEYEDRLRYPRSCTQDARELSNKVWVSLWPRKVD